MQIFIAILITYLYSSIPFSLLVGFLYKKDIRKEGSKNVGSTNLGRTCGKKAFVLGFIMDGSKGIIAVLIANFFGIAPLILLPICLLGHALPLFNKFKGGKGVATAFGFVLAYTFWLAIIAITSFLIILKITKYVSLSSILAIGTYVLCLFLTHADFVYTLVVSLLLIAVIYLHRENITRIKNGNERKITWM